MSRGPRLRWTRVVGRAQTLATAPTGSWVPHRGCRGDTTSLERTRRAKVRAAMGFDRKGWIENVDASLVERHDAGARVRRVILYALLAAVVMFEVWLLIRPHLA